MKYHIVKKHSKAFAKVVQKCKICDKNYHSLYLLREHKWKEHGAQRGSAAQSVDVAQLMGDVHVDSCKEELEMRKPFLVDSQMENERQRVHNFNIDTLHPK